VGKKRTKDRLAELEERLNALTAKADEYETEFIPNLVRAIEFLKLIAERNDALLMTWYYEKKQPIESHNAPIREEMRRLNKEVEEKRLEQRFAEAGMRDSYESLTKLCKTRTERSHLAWQVATRLGLYARDISWEAAYIERGSYLGGLLRREPPIPPDLCMLPDVSDQAQFSLLDVCKRAGIPENWFGRPRDRNSEIESCVMARLADLQSAKWTCHTVKDFEDEVRKWEYYFANRMNYSKGVRNLFKNRGDAWRYWHSYELSRGADRLVNLSHVDWLTVALEKARQWLAIEMPQEDQLLRGKIERIKIAKGSRARVRGAAAAHLDKTRELAATVKRQLRDQAAIVQVCPYCANPLGDDAEADHIHPVCLGGFSTPENMVYVCAKCNGTKHDRTLREFILSEGLNRDEVEERLTKLGKRF
jgi:hypothetical protein